MTIRFYSWPQSSGFGAHWALEELGLAYEYVKLDRDKNEQRSPEYLAINPNGKVPALVDGPESYFESLAILLHLADRYGAERGLWPASGNQRGPCSVRGMSAHFRPRRRCIDIQAGQPVAFAIGGARLAGWLGRLITGNGTAVAGSGLGGDGSLPGTSLPGLSVRWRPG